MAGSFRGGGIARVSGTWRAAGEEIDERGRVWWRMRREGGARKVVRSRWFGVTWRRVKVGTTAAVRTANI